jgi:hypothetical protein
VSPDPFDDIDRALASGLSALAPEVDGGDEKLAEVRPRFQRARTRARVVKIGGTVAILLAIGSVATLAAPSSQRSHVQVFSPPTTREPRRHPVRTSTTSVATTTVPATSPTSTPTTATSPAIVGSTNPGNGSTATTPVTVPGTTPGTDPHGDRGGSGSSNGGDGQGHGGSSTSTTAPGSHNEVHEYQSHGGSVRVRFSHGVLSLISVSRASGYHSHVVQNRPDDIEVRFSNSHGEWRIRIRVEHGRPVSEVDHT